MQKLHEYRGRFLGIAAVAVHKFFTRSYYDYNEGLKYCFQTPESIRAFVRSILSPSGARGSFHWAHWYSSHVRGFILHPYPAPDDEIYKTEPPRSV